MTSDPTESTNWTPTSTFSTNYTPENKNSTTWRVNSPYGSYYLLLENSSGTDGLLNENGSDLLGLEEQN